LLKDVGTTQSTRFRERFGDVFIDGPQRGGEYFATFEIVSVDQSFRESIATKVEASFNGLLASGNLDVDVQNAAASTSSHVEVRVHVFQNGSIDRTDAGNYGQGTQFPAHCRRNKCRCVRGDRVRLITRGGYDWTKRYPWIVEAALKNRQKHFVIDGEAVILGVDGVSDFNALHSGKHNEEVQLCAFDVLAIDGDDLRSLPLSMRRPTPLARIAYVKLMTAALRTSRCIDRGVSSRNMGRLVRVMPRRRLEKVVNKGE